MEHAVIFALIILLGVREYFSFKEHQEVYDRLMSKNLGEFKDNREPEENQLEEEKDKNVVPIESAMEDMVYGSEEEN